MNITRIRTCLMVCSLTFTLRPVQGVAQQNSDAPTAATQPVAVQPASTERDGQPDFDPLIGTWKYHLKRRTNPLTGSNNWVEFDGTGACYKIWDGRAQLDTIEVDGPMGHIEGLTLRTYNRQSHQWSLYWANAKTGIIDPPQVGEFKNGRGEFFAQDRINGKVILIRFAWSNMTTSTPTLNNRSPTTGARRGKSTGSRTRRGWLTRRTRHAERP